MSLRKEIFKICKMNKESLGEFLLKSGVGGGLLKWHLKIWIARIENPLDKDVKLPCEEAEPAQVPLPESPAVGEGGSLTALKNNSLGSYMGQRLSNIMEWGFPISSQSGSYNVYLDSRTPCQHQDYHICMGMEGSPAWSSCLISTFPNSSYPRWSSPITLLHTPNPRSASMSWGTQSAQMF